MATTARVAVLGSYRRVLKAALFTFRGDTPRIADAFAAARRVYQQFGHLDDEAEIRRMAAEGDDAAHFMRTQIMQGEYDKETKRVVIKVQPEHTTDSNASASLTSVQEAATEVVIPAPPIRETSRAGVGDSGARGL